MAFDRIRIQNKLRAEAVTGPWTMVRYGSDGVAAADTNTKVAPATILVNETEARFDEAERNRRDPRTRERSDWLFMLVLKFNEGEVIAEGFEDRITAGGVLIPADVSAGERQITLELEAAEYSHPPQHDPQGGTKVTYTFRAQQAPQ